MIKLRRFLLNKLIRDNSLDLADGKGRAKLKILDNNTALEAFKIKLQEEVAEAVSATTAVDIKHELADILEVIHGLAHAMQIPFDDLETIRKKKKAQSGGFEKQLFVEYVDLPSDHPYVAYNLSQPNKTPELPYTTDDI